MIQLRAIDREQIREDARHVTEIGVTLFFVSLAVFWIGENSAWNGVPSIVETVIYYLIGILSALFLGVLLYGRYTVDENIRTIRGRLKW